MHYTKATEPGRIVKTTGDGLLVEFASVVDAVRCAVDVQREMSERNTGVPAERRIEFRIGINLGDIIKDGRDIFGDGVNVAARLEALAEPGGICVNRVVRDQVRDKLDPRSLWRCTLTTEWLTPTRCTGMSMSIAGPMMMR